MIYNNIMNENTFWIRLGFRCSLKKGSIIKEKISIPSIKTKNFKNHKPTSFIICQSINVDDEFTNIKQVLKVRPIYTDPKMFKLEDMNISKLEYFQSYFDLVVT